MRQTFFRFARWAQRRIASPVHLIAFLIVSVVWAVWAASRGFDAFAQLVLNTPTTWAEYLFEILVLAAALGAEDSSERVLEELRDAQGQLVALQQQVLEIDRRILLDVEDGLG